MLFKGDATGKSRRHLVVVRADPTDLPEIEPRAEAERGHDRHADNRDQNGMGQPDTSKALFTPEQPNRLILHKEAVHREGTSRLRLA